ncbi:hypothetical protein [Bacillus marasmi]|uniref:hypothetical protein n=1 Tax=Bacillus marasmi TaxID=1926279 RepID=UPI0011CB1B34|nr:hypothetical protein [Bacillus marasmi]
MVEFIMDFAIVALLIIGITAMMGAITNGIGSALFSGRKRSEFVDQSAKFQVGWKQVGGKKK